MRASDVPPATWRKSSRTNGGSDQTACIEVAQLAGQVAMRDSKNPTGPALALPRAQWQAFLTNRALAVLDELDEGDHGGASGRGPHCASGETV